MLKRGYRRAANRSMIEHRREVRPARWRALPVLGLTGVLCVLGSGAAQAEIYKCVDLDGHTSYLSRPCPDLDLLDRVIADNGIYDARRQRPPSGARGDDASDSGSDAVPEPLPPLGAAAPVPTPWPEPSGDY